MPIEFESRREPIKTDDTIRWNTTGLEPLLSRKPSRGRRLRLWLHWLRWNIAALGIGIPAALFAFYAVFQAMEMERAAIAAHRANIGKCYSNGIGGIGRLVEVKQTSHGIFAFPSGITERYPFNALQEVQCPQFTEKGMHHG